MSAPWPPPSCAASQGDDPRYWQAAPSLKHFLANSNEDDRTRAVVRLRRAPVPGVLREAASAMAVRDGGRARVMASYNSCERGAGGACIRCCAIGRDRRSGASSASSAPDGGAAMTPGRERPQGARPTCRRPPRSRRRRRASTTILDRLEGQAAHGGRGAQAQLISEAELDEGARAACSGCHDHASGPARSARARAVCAQSVRGHGPGAVEYLPGSTRAISVRDGDRQVDRPAEEQCLGAPAPGSDEGLAPFGRGDRSHWPTRRCIGTGTGGGFAAVRGRRRAPGIEARGQPGAADPRAGQRALGRTTMSGAAVAAVRKAADVADRGQVGNDPTCGPNMAHDWDDNRHLALRRARRRRSRAAIRRSPAARPGRLGASRVLAANPRTVDGAWSRASRSRCTWSQRRTRTAILHMTHASQDEGTALARRDLRRLQSRRPSRRRPGPRPSDQLPPMMDYDIRHGRTYMYSKATPLYPFGYGLVLHQLPLREPAHERAEGSGVPHRHCRRDGRHEHGHAARRRDRAVVRAPSGLQGRAPAQAAPRVPARQPPSRRDADDRSAVALSVTWLTVMSESTLERVERAGSSFSLDIFRGTLR